jgi:hypothetical protein
LIERLATRGRAVGERLQLAKGRPHESSRGT